MDWEETIALAGLSRRPPYWDERYAKGVENMSKPLYQVVVERDVLMTCRDGVRLAVDIYRPDTKDGETFPGLVAWSSYGKGVQLIERVPLQFKTVLMDHTIEAGDIEFYVRRGYVVAIPDARGIGKSEGHWDGLYGKQEQEDCYDLIEWLAEEPYCDGSIGMIGISYFSIIQPLVAALKPPHLKAIMMCEVLDSLYLHNYIGGAFFDRSYLYNHFCPVNSALSWSERRYSQDELLRRVEQRRSDPEVSSSALLTRVLSCWPPRHQSYFFDVILHNMDDEFWAERSLIGKEKDINIPMYLMSEYYDRGRFTQGPFHLYNK
ncbi:MAG: CocE/NonD family hydrolase [Anaerolineaceae bacterium]|nr:CocE/NonD family hydrolase [Anaerolineaceae bacterium]